MQQGGAWRCSSSTNNTPAAQLLWRCKAWTVTPVQGGAQELWQAARCKSGRAASPGANTDTSQGAGPERQRSGRARRVDKGKDVP